MKPPTILAQKGPPGAQVAAVLRAGRAECPVDLGDTWVVVPTAGAARSIRRHLAADGPGVLAPRFVSPMDLVLPDAGDLAGASDRETAWARVLRDAPRSRFAALVPGAVRLDSPEDLLGVAARLLAVCDTLAEAALTPSSPELACECAGDAARWEAFARLHREYLALLARSGLRDPNEARLQVARQEHPPAGLRRVVVACVPDLPRVAEVYLARLAGAGVAVEVLAWHPGGVPGPLDAWGRPDPAWWSENPAPVPSECLAAASSAGDEAEALVDFAAERGAEGFALVAAAAECMAPLSAEVARRGGVPYSPQGRPLAQGECATLLLGWQSFRRSGRLRDLRRLLDLPSFVTRLARPSHLTASEAVEACEWLASDRLCETVGAAADWHRHAPAPSRRDRARMHDLAGCLLEAIAKLTDAGDDASAPGLEGCAAPGEHEALDDVLDSVASSGLAIEESEEFRQALLRAAIGRASVFTPAPEGAVEIPGWLEAVWSDATVVCVAGCREGALPSGAVEDAFLPDGVRSSLGLPSLASRFARDAFLLSALLASRGAQGLRLGVSRFRPGGEPNRPSRLLLACPDAELADRVRRVFQPAARRRAVMPPPVWKLRFPVQPPPESLSATAFKRYLDCPLRFYLSRVAGLQSFDPEAREINAADFGTLAHSVLERFHKDGLADQEDEAVIAEHLERGLEHEVARQYGRHPTPVVRVQAEFLRTRLRAFAPAQAAARREGWRIIETEFAVRREDGHRAGPLLLTGVMDRVEVHEEFGLRVLDYKTFARAMTPEETHFGPVRSGRGFAPVPITRQSAKGRPLQRSWRDLQLPLYRRLAAEIWPDHAARGISVGYVLLPSETTDTPFATLELDDDAVKSAEECAAAVSGLVARGVFWPPAPAGEVEHDDFESWFGGEDPADLIDPETIRALEGRP